MKILCLVLLCISIFILGKKAHENNEIDGILFELYSNNFKDFLYIDDESKLMIDSKALEFYLENKGFNSKVLLEKDVFIINIEDKIYRFSIGENHE